MTRVEGPDSQLKRFQILSAVLAAAVVLALVAMFLLYQAKQDADDKADAAKGRLGDLDAAEAAARELLVDMTTYDYQHLGDTFDWLDQITNADLRKSLGSRKDDLEKVIRLGKVTAEGEVQESAYRPGADDKSVVVIAFVHQTIRDDSHQGAKTEDQWATLTMVPGDSDSRWVAEDIQLSGIPNPDGTVTQQ